MAALIAILCIPYAVYAQPNTPDKIFVRLDKTFYVAGETINYAVFFLNRDPVRSRIVHVDIIDSHDSVYLKQMLPVTDNSSSGKIEIPVAFQEGNYLFRCYTSWNLNFGNNFIYHVPLPIYNDLSGEGFDNLYIDGPDKKADTIGYNENGSYVISIENNEPVRTGDSVYLNFQTKDRQPAILSIGVFDLNLIEPFEFNLQKDYLQRLRSTDVVNTEARYAPEKNLVFQGMILEQLSSEPVTSNVLTVYDVRNFSFTRIKSRDGKFLFELPIFEGSADIQIINMNPYQDKVPVVKIQSLVPERLPVTFTQNPVVRSDNVIKYLYYSKLRKQITEVFQRSEADSIPSSSTLLRQSIPDKSYSMEDYRYIKDVEDFILQAVQNASSIREGNMRYPQLFNRETKKYFMTKPFLMVDNYFVFNDSLVYSIPFSQLHRIDIYNTNSSIFTYFDPIMIQGGVIAIYTKNNFLGEYVNNLPNLLNVKGLPEKMTKEKLDISYSHPELEPVIFWNSIVPTDESGFIRIAYKQNDVTGNCMIQLIGKRPDGQLFEERFTYYVSE